MEKEQILTSKEIVRLFDDKKGPFIEQVPEIIKEERTKCGLSAADLAKKAGISRTYLWQIEEKNSRPSVEYLANIVPHIGLQLVIRRIVDQVELAITPGADTAGALKRRIGLLEESLPDGIKLRFKKR